MISFFSFTQHYTARMCAIIEEKFMASQISHIVYARKYFDQLETGQVESVIKIDKDEFILGCVFPDIRRIEAKIKRRDTHLCFSPLDLNFSGLSSFQAGWKFHVYCDMRREEILNKYGFYELLHSTDIYNQPAKDLEDELVYGEYNNWEKLVNYFNNPPFIDSELDFDPASFYLWYAMIARYIEKKPDDKSMRTFLVKQPGLLKDLDEIMKSITELRKNDRVKDILGKVWQEMV